MLALSITYAFTELHILRSSLTMCHFTIQITWKYCLCNLNTLDFRLSFIK